MTTSLAKLLPPQLSSALVALYSHTLIKRIAIGILGIFEVIFIYQIFDHSLMPVLVYYLVIYLLYLLLIPLGAQVVAEAGYQRAMRVGVIFLSGWLLVMALVALGWLQASWLWLAAAVVSVYKTLYWLPYHVELAEFTTGKNRGRVISLIDSSVIIIGVALPIISAFIISQFGFASLISMTLLVMLLSLIPLQFLPAVKENYSYGYLETWRYLAARFKGRELWAYVAEGVEDIAGAIIWPIFIFLLLGGKYLEVGYVSSLVILATALLKLIVGEWSDEYGPKPILRWSSWFTSLAWLIRVFIQTFNQIFLVGIFHNLAQASTRTAWNTLWYHRTAAQGHLIDEYTALREMAMNIGRLLTLVLVILWLPFIPFTVTFLLAAVAVLLLNLLR